MNKILDQIQAFVNKIFRLEIRKYPNKFQRAQKAYLEKYHIDVILDVGANTGQFGNEMFNIGYKQRIISFEPVHSSYEQLVISANSRSNWQALHFALGNFDGWTEINKSLLSPSSSILPFVENMIDVVPDLHFTGKERIEIKKLDSIFDDYITAHQNVYLKIDTQGFEKAILEGAQNSLKRIKIIQLEMSLVEIYKGELLMQEMTMLMKSLGFTIWALEPSFYHPVTRQLLQVDAIFVKNDIR